MNLRSIFVNKLEFRIDTFNPNFFFRSKVNTLKLTGWINVDQIGPNGRKWAEVDQIGPNGQNGSKWTEWIEIDRLDQSGP